MREQYNKQLELLSEHMAEMGKLCVEAIQNAIWAFLKQDLEAVKNVERNENEINSIEREIENLCLKLLLLQQPVAGDLRQVSSALKMITDLERIGDQALDISEIVATAPFINNGHCELIEDMGRATIKMVSESMDAYFKEDLELARAVIDYDDVVDVLFDRVKNMAVKQINEDLKAGEFAIDLLMIAKYFERIGDHATNIAEWVCFSISGVRPGDH